MSYAPNLTVLCLVLSISVLQGYKDFINVAEGKETKQSDTGWNGYSSKAVDGKTSGNYHSGSCTHTKFGEVSYWEVDLGRVYNISHINVYGRTDCCSNRINGAKLWVGNNLCNTLHDQMKDQVEVVRCRDVFHQFGRRVRIEATDYLTLCEVEVMVQVDISVDEAVPTVTPRESMYEVHGEFVNVAVKKPAVQSSTHYEGYASRAVDGFNKTHWNSRSCTYAKNGGMNYWEVDLGRVYKLDHVTIFSRSDRDQKWLNGAKVKIGSRVCETLSKMEEKSMKVITCNGDKERLVGRVIRVEKWNSAITLCELQAFVKKGDIPEREEEIPTVDFTALGEEIEEYYNVAKGKNTTSSSPRYGGVSSRAVDGVTAQAWSQNSCTHGSGAGYQWWKVDLGRVYQIHHVRVWGRNDISSTQLGNARLWIGEHRCGYIQDLKKEGKPAVVTCTEEESRGRHVTVELLQGTLMLCEVQVMVKKSDIKLTPNVVKSYGERKGNFTNVALRKRSWQTSTGWDGFAERGNDGFRNTHYHHRSCTHTHRSNRQSWSVDLGQVYKVHEVHIWGRTDCCTERIRNTRVHVGRNYCGMIPADVDLKKMPFVVKCTEEGDGEGPAGKIVEIDRINDYLTLCEVEVLVRNEDLAEDELPSTFPVYENVAATKIATQSSTDHGGVASRAVDEYTATHWRHASCTHTHKQPLNWWSVDLVDEYYIDKITIYGRGDCCHERLHNAVVSVDNTTVAVMEYKGDKQTKWEYELNGAVSGSRVSVMVRDMYLTLCEVLVWVNHDYDPTKDDTRIDLSVPNLAKEKVATSSGTWLGGSPDKAIDGNTDADFFKGSCISTSPIQGDHWWRVDLGEEVNVGNVIIFPRFGPNSMNYIHDAEVKVDEHSCGKISYSASALSYRLDCDGATGSAVTVTKTGYLSFCEVVVQAAE